MANLEDRQECQDCPSSEACAAGDWDVVGFEGCAFWVPEDGDINLFRRTMQITLDHH